jgi:hypothetical protein
MVEKQPKVEAKEAKGEALEHSAEKQRSIEKKLKAESKEAAKKHSGEKLKAKQEIEQALSGKEKAPSGAEKAEKRPRSATKHVKKEQYKATMRRVEGRLPAYQRGFSKVIHNPVVDAVSNVAGKTVARPSGLLGGAIAAFIGLLVIYLNARRIGFEYPSGAAFIFFISVGWLSGVMIEYLIGALRRLFKRR